MSEKQLEVAPKANGWALLPFVVFIGVYLGVALYLQRQGVEMAFYQLPAPIAAMIGIIFAFIMFKGTIEEKFNDFIKGCGSEDIITMCIIYLLAGAFASVASAMGGVESTANLGLSIIPPQYITAGLFAIASFLSLATGTSVGTIAAIGPIAVQVADTTNLNLVLVMGAIVGGAMFGDNLSMISDTTIAATRSQGCEMRDKFKVNFLIALPAAILTFILLLIFARPETVVELGQLDYSIIKVVPYILVLGLALSGMNVFVTLVIGIFSATAIGLFLGEITLLGAAQETYGGFESMYEIFLLSLFTGGLAHMVASNGGIQWVLERIQKLIRGPKSAELGIAALVSAADLAVANNTVAIIISGPIARGICDEYKVDPRRSASLLDTWSCVFQGLIPYGAQVLLACSLTGGRISPVQIIPMIWYVFFLAGSAILSIFIPFADGEIRKNPWDWSKNKAQSTK